MNDTTYFENHVSKKDKDRLIEVVGKEGIQRQIEMEVKLAAIGRPDRVASAKEACRRRKEKRNKTMNTISAEIVTITPNIGERLLASNKNNRNIRETLVSYYIGVIERGEWVVTNQGLGVDRDGVLVDGQHRLTAMQRCGWPNLDVLMVSGLAKNVAHAIDQHAKRSMRDILRISMDLALHNHTVAACNVILRATTSRLDKTITFSPTQLAHVYESYQQELELICPLLKGTCAAPISAAFVVVMEGRPGHRQAILDAAEKLLSGSDMARGHPILTLRDWMHRTRGIKGGKTIQKERYIKTTRALEAHITGRKLHRLYA